MAQCPLPCVGFFVGIVAEKPHRFLPIAIFMGGHPNIMKTLNMMRLAGIGLVITFTFAAVVVPTQAQGTNLTDACVDTFDPDTDYFPDKASFDYAASVTVEYFNHYKVVEVTQPWVGAEAGFEYVLVQCGAPTPDGFDDAQIISVPAADTFALSTTYLPHLVQLGVLENLVGVDFASFVSTPEVLELAEAGELLEVGSGSSINVEVVLDAEPDLIMAYGSGFADFDTHPVLLEAGLPVVLAAEFTEADPLARAEWLKFTALFYNQEATANDIFDNIASEYNGLLELTADISTDERPVVLTNSIFGDTWAVSGAESYAGQFIADAGGVVALGDDEIVALDDGSVAFPIEEIYDRAFDADFWLVNAYNVFSVNDLLGQDERYEDFEAVSNGGLYSNIGRMGPTGGFDYFETGVIEPHVILADLIHILHPELLPDHELEYYAPLQ